MGEAGGGICPIARMIVGEAFALFGQGGSTMEFRRRGENYSTGMTSTSARIRCHEEPMNTPLTGATSP